MLSPEEWRWGNVTIPAGSGGFTNPQLRIWRMNLYGGSGGGTVTYGGFQPTGMGAFMWTLEPNEHLLVVPGGMLPLDINLAAAPTAWAQVEYIWKPLG